MARKDSTAPKMVVHKDVMVPMRDGVHLATDIAIPSDDGIAHASGQFPALMIRTPYDKDMVSAFPENMVATAAVVGPAKATAAGYAIIYQDVRGSRKSEGKLSPMLREGQDAADTIAWIRQQSWSDGRVAPFGPSYHGGVSMMSATEEPEGLVTAFVQAPANNQFNSGWGYFEGVFKLHIATQWTIMQSLDPATHDDEESAAAAREELRHLLPDQDMNWLAPNFPEGFFDRLLRTTPLKDMPVARHMSFWRNWIENRDNPEYFAVNDMTDQLSRVTVPMIQVGGWYDGFIRNSYELYEGLSTQAATPEARAGQRLLIGPWSHGDCPECPPSAVVDGQALQLAWMDYCFKGIQHPLFDHPVTLFVMGEDRWRAETSWPLEGTRRTRFYLHSQGHANSAAGDGLLSTDAPSDEASDQYQYDPNNSVPMVGGIAMAGGRLAQNVVEARDDVLCYTSAELTEDVEVTGRVSATLFAASSATDTDWWMRLVDVRPDGRADTLCHGVTRARYRHSRTVPEALIPGEIVEYAIDMQATSNVFKKGHRIRLEISSSCFPLGDRNPNIFADLNDVTEAEFVVATQTIYHDSAHPSRVELPIIPMERARRWIDTPFPLAGGK